MGFLNSVTVSVCYNGGNRVCNDQGVAERVTESIATWTLYNSLAARCTL